MVAKVIKIGEVARKNAKHEVDTGG